MDCFAVLLKFQDSFSFLAIPLVIEAWVVFLTNHDLHSIPRLIVKHSIMAGVMGPGKEEADKMHLFPFLLCRQPCEVINHRMESRLCLIP